MPLDFHLPGDDSPTHNACFTPLEHVTAHGRMFLYCVTCDASEMMTPAEYAERLDAAKTRRAHTLALLRLARG